MASPLSIGCTFSDRIEALLDGRVAIAGYAHDLRIVEPQRLFRAVLRDVAYDVAELSMASHIAAVGSGRRDYVGLPVFMSRSFRHSNLYVRTDRIRRPEDLAGRRIGVIDFQQTAGLWLRGILADEHGVDRKSVEWVAAGLHVPALEERSSGPLPAGQRIRRSSSTLDTMLAAGEIDAVISPTAPSCASDTSVPVARMWPHFTDLERDYWRRTAIFPIMHLIVVRRALLDTDPTLPQALFTAFDKARELAAADLRSRDFPKLIMPWILAYARETREVLEGDPWSYGFDANRPTIETMLRYAREDGLLPLGVEAESLFS